MIKRDTAALIAFIDSRQNMPHEWGRTKNDCVSFCLDAVEAETGVKVAKSLKWAGPKAALSIIDKFGTLENAFDHYFERVPIAFAQRGDIAGIDPKAMIGLNDTAVRYFKIHPMIVEGITLVGPGDAGNARTSRKAMVCAWSAVKQK